MHTSEITGNWNEQKGKLKQKIALLMSNDLLFEAGMRDELLGKLQAKLGKSREECESIIAAL